MSKRITTLFFVLLVSIELVGGQEQNDGNPWIFGIKIGTNYTNTIKNESEVREFKEQGHIIHNLNNSEGQSGTSFGLLLSYNIHPKISLLTEFEIVSVKTKYDYNASEFRNGFGLYEETFEGVFEQKIVSIQVPIAAKFSFGKNKRLGIIGGFYFNDRGTNSGRWNYTSAQHGTIISGDLVPLDPPKRLLRAESFGFNTKNHLGWVVGGEAIIPITAKLNILVSIEYQKAFSSENVLIPYKRKGVYLNLGVLFRKK